MLALFVCSAGGQAAILPGGETRLADLREQVAGNPDLAGDGTVRLGLAVAASFDGRIRSGGPAGAEGATSIVSVLQSAADHGVMVDLLLSPHYMPGWAASVSNLTAITRRGHIGYNIDHPVARDFIERWLRTIVPMVRDSPALFSLCLSNEPEYVNSGRDSYSRPAWVAFLADRHATIDVLNALYGSNHAGFDEVPVPPVDQPADENIAARRAYYDWACFNHAYIAAWHRWMNDIVKSMAPDIPTQSPRTPGRACREHGDLSLPVGGRRHGCASPGSVVRRTGYRSLAERRHGETGVGRGVPGRALP